MISDLILFLFWQHEGEAKNISLVPLKSQKVGLRILIEITAKLKSSCT